MLLSLLLGVGSNLKHESIEIPDEPRAHLLKVLSDLESVRFVLVGYLKDNEPSFISKFDFGTGLNIHFLALVNDLPELGPS